MVLSLSISSEAEAKLRAKASAAGIDVETYAARHLERMAALPKSLKEIGGSSERPAMSEDELADFLEAEKHASRDERRAKRSQ